MKKVLQKFFITILCLTTFVVINILTALYLPVSFAAGVFFCSILAFPFIIGSAFSEIDKEKP